METKGVIPVYAGSLQRRIQELEEENERLKNRIIELKTQTGPGETETAEQHQASSK